MKIQYRKVNIDIHSGNGEVISSIKLDSRKYDNIGWTEESLDKYLRSNILVNRESYLITFDKIYDY